MTINRYRRIKYIIFFTLFFSTFAIEIGAKELIDSTSPLIVADVNNVPITEKELEEAMHPYDSEIAGSQTIYLLVREKILNQLIEGNLILQEAKAKKITIVSGEIEQIVGVIKSRFGDQTKFSAVLELSGLKEDTFRKKIEERLMKIKVTDWAVKSKIQLSQEEIDRFCENYGINVHAQHILVKTEEEAVDLLRRAEAGEDFSKLAREHSLCPSSQVGGDLGFFGHGAMVKEFENASFAMSREGELSGVVKTQFGYHIIRFIAKKTPTPDAVKEIKDNLINELYGKIYIITGEGLDFGIRGILEEQFIGRQLELGYTQWIKELKNKAKITIYPASEVSQGVDK